MLIKSLFWQIINSIVKSFLVQVVQRFPVFSIQHQKRFCIRADLQHLILLKTGTNLIQKIAGKLNHQILALRNVVITVHTKWRKQKEATRLHLVSLPIDNLIALPRDQVRYLTIRVTMGGILTIRLRLVAKTTDMMLGRFLIILKFSLI